MSGGPGGPREPSEADKALGGGGGGPGGPREPSEADNVLAAIYRPFKGYIRGNMKILKTHQLELVQLLGFLCCVLS